MTQHKKSDECKRIERLNNEYVSVENEALKATERGKPISEIRALNLKGNQIFQKIKKIKADEARKCAEETLKH
ncbi:MAG: hypothetical protein WED05_02620 [Candidatus Atabeyarchaeum deiterrae]